MHELWNVQELARKLVTTGHLSVPERRALLGANPVPGSLLCSTILSILKDQGSFPPQWRAGDPFEGGLIEVATDGSWSITWKAEVGMLRYEVIEIQKFSTVASLPRTVRSYAQRFFGSNIDGVKVDWDA
jgi:hypothetical protein